LTFAPPILAESSNHQLNSREARLDYLRLTSRSSVAISHKGISTGKGFLVTLYEDEVHRHAEPVFRGTPVPFRVLIDYLEGGDTLDQFLEQYPSVSVNSPYPQSKKRG